MTRSRQWLRIGLASSLATALLIAVIAARAASELNPANLKPALLEAIERATGRTATIGGKVELRFSLTPTVTLDDVVLSNPTGFPHPDLIKIASVNLRIPLAPLLLHRFEIEQMLLQRPEMALETDHSGRPNWLLLRATPPDTRTPANADVHTREAAPEPLAISIKTISVNDGHVVWVNEDGSTRFEADVPWLTIHMSTATVVQIKGAVTYNGRHVDLSARTSQPWTLGDASPTTAWPVKLKLESGGARILVDGQMVDPLRARGYRLTLDANVPDPSVFAAWFPGIRLRSLQGVAMHAELNDSDGSRAIPAFSALMINVRSVALNALINGARLENLAFTATGKVPLELTGRVRLANSSTATRLRATFGDLQWLNGGAFGPISLDLEAGAWSAQAIMKGTIREPRRFAGFALDVWVDLPDPIDIFKSAPPTLKLVSLQTRLTDSPGLVPFHLTSSAGDVAGQFSIARDPIWTIDGHISSLYLDLDTLRSHVPGESLGIGLAGSIDPAVRGITAPLLSEQSLRFDRLRAIDAHIGFAVDRVLLGGDEMGAVEGELSVLNGVLRLDPFKVDVSDYTSGRRQNSALLVVDTNASPTMVHLTTNAPALGLGPMLAVLELPGSAHGTAEIHADLTANGDSIRALANSLDGWSTLAIADGQLPSGLAKTWLDQPRPLRGDGADVIGFHCFAMRADAKAGIVTFGPLMSNPTTSDHQQSGEVDFRGETPIIHLRPGPMTAKSDAGETEIGKIGIGKPEIGKTGFETTGVATQRRASGQIRTNSVTADISAAGLNRGAFGGSSAKPTTVTVATNSRDSCSAAGPDARWEPSTTVTAAPHPSLSASTGRR